MQNKLQKKRTNSVLILSGTGNPARAAANMYVRELASPECTVSVIENALCPNFIMKFFMRRFTRYGLLNTIGVFLLRLKLMFSPSIEKKYTPILSTCDFNNIDHAFIESLNPDIVIANACALLDSAFISFLKGRGCEVINVHNGLNPRYRGTGNIWAFYERNFEQAGVTLHHIDTGIDTGEIIAERRIDFRELGVPFAETDTAAFQEGAKLAIEYVRNGSKNLCIESGSQRSRCYTYPSWTEYFQAEARFSDWINGKVPATNEKAWQDSFKSLAIDQSKNKYQRQHWGNSDSVKSRDQTVRQLVELFCNGSNIFDIGCGDGRYRAYWPDWDYIGCDYSIETVFLGGELELAQPHPAVTVSAKTYKDSADNWFLVASVDDLPIKPEYFDNIVAVGLFQHIDNTGLSADEMLRVTTVGGHIVLNTLRQFSYFELLIILTVGVVNPEMRKLGQAMWKQDYFSGRIISGVKLARRYTVKELRHLFAPNARIVSTRYSGILSSRLFSRELFLVFEKKK